MRDEERFSVCAGRRNVEQSVSVSFDQITDEG